jgi:type I restriction enzyme S subunit
MKSLIIRLPNDIKEQEAIARILDDIDTEISDMETRREKTHAVKQGMLQELLTGKTRLLD